VAIFYGSGTPITGTITAKGGAKGVTRVDPNFPSVLVGLAQNGQDGTIYIVNSATVSPKKASAPTPANGSYVLCRPDPALFS